jgi:hypothetical protein
MSGLFLMLGIALSQVWRHPARTADMPPTGAIALGARLRWDTLNQPGEIPRYLIPG